MEYKSDDSDSQADRWTTYKLLAFTLCQMYKIVSVKVLLRLVTVQACDGAKPGSVFLSFL